MFFLAVKSPACIPLSHLKKNQFLWVKILITIKMTVHVYVHRLCTAGLYMSIKYSSAYSLQHVFEVSNLVLLMLWTMLKHQKLK